MNLSDFVETLQKRILPLTILSHSLDNDRIIVACTYGLDMPVFCGVCGIEGSRYGNLRHRVIRDLDVDGRMVLIGFQFPRVRCKQHGVVMAFQEFFETRSLFTIAFEDLALSLVSDDVTVTEVATQLRISRNVLGRILLRSYKRHRGNQGVLSASKLRRWDVGANRSEPNSGFAECKIESTVTKSKRRWGAKSKPSANSRLSG